MGSHWGSQRALLVRLRVVIQDLVRRILPIIVRENMELWLCAMTVRGRNAAMGSMTLSAQGHSTVTWEGLFVKHTMRILIQTALRRIKLKMNLDN